MQEDANVIAALPPGLYELTAMVKEVGCAINWERLALSEPTSRLFRIHCEAGCELRTDYVTLVYVMYEGAADDFKEHPATSLWSKLPCGFTSLETGIYQHAGPEPQRRIRSSECGTASHCC